MTMKTRFIKEKNLEIFKITVKEKKPLVSIEKNQKFLKTHLIFNDGVVQCNAKQLFCLNF